MFYYTIAKTEDEASEVSLDEIEYPHKPSGPFWEWIERINQECGTFCGFVGFDCFEGSDLEIFLQRMAEYRAWLLDQGEIIEVRHSELLPIEKCKTKDCIKAVDQVVRLGKEALQAGKGLWFMGD